MVEGPRRPSHSTPKRSRSLCRMSCGRIRRKSWTCRQDRPRWSRTPAVKPEDCQVRVEKEAHFGGHQQSATSDFGYVLLTARISSFGNGQSILDQAKHKIRKNKAQQQCVIPAECWALDSRCRCRSIIQNLAMGGIPRVTQEPQKEWSEQGKMSPWRDGNVNACWSTF